MKKYYYVGVTPKREVKIGDKVVINSSFFPITLTITPKILAELVLAGLVCMEESEDSVESKKDTKVPMDARYYIANFGKKQGWNFNDTVKNLDSIGNIYPMSSFILILREIAVELDKQYPDHINNCKEVYTLSSLNGKIYKVPTVTIRNFKNFAAFRTEEDAKIACSILRNQIKAMFVVPKHEK